MNNRGTTNPLLNKFIGQVKSNPDKTAVVYRDKKLTYAEFESTIHRLAFALKKQYGHLINSTENTPVLIGVMCHDKFITLCCEFAILALGATFVPFNFTDAVDRQKFMVEKSGITIMLTDDDLYEINDSLNYFHIPSLYKIQSISISDTDTYINPNSNDLAYVLFTSGSTSKNPKGVMRSQLSLFNQMTRDYKNDLNIVEDDVFLNLAIPSHDQAIVDCFGAILNGCTLCLYDPKDMNVSDLHHFMKNNKITIFSSIPSMFSIIFENVNDKSTFPDLRVVTIGGEETLVSHAQLYQKSCPDNCLLINGYGATEISWVSSYVVYHQTNLSHFKALPLGCKTKSVEIKLLPFEDDSNNISDQISELCISSDSLASGYLNDEAATSEAFFTDQDGKIYYRTGDIVALDNNQCMHFHGRKFWHEKISGKRVDIREVENELKIYLKNCAVIAYGEGVKKKLYAFYTDDIRAKNLTQIKSRLGNMLEKHMLPQLIDVDELPTLPNGKVDRLSLCKILEDKEIMFKADFKKIKFLQQSSNIDSAIEGFWCEVFGITFRELNRVDTFQSLGGDSQLAIQLTNKINHYFRDKHDLDIIIDPFVLYKDVNSCIKLKKYTNKLYKTTTSPDSTKYPDLVIGRCNVDLLDSSSFGHNDYKAYYGDKNGDRIHVIEYDYIGLKIITDYFNRLHNIQIQLCDTHSSIIQTIRKYVNDESCRNQIGVVLFHEQNKRAHPVASVLCKNETTNKVSLLIADGTQGFYGLGRAFPEIVCIKKYFPDIDIQFDLTGRQIDTNSCSTDAVLYLVAALQRNMLKESIFLTKTLKTAFNAGSKRYFVRKTSSVPDEISSCSLFVSPIQTYYHSNVSNIPEVYGITQNREVKSLIVKLNDTHEYKEHLAACVFVGLRDRMVKGTFNTILWKKSFEFREIIKNIMDAQSKNNLTPKQNYVSIVDSKDKINKQINRAESLDEIKPEPASALILELKNYIDKRNKGGEYHPYSIFGRISGFNKETKTSASQSMIMLLQNKNVTNEIKFTKLQFEALREGELGEIISKHEHLLPYEFKVIENANSLWDFRLLN